jgi:type I restriction enzyme, S subunit
MTSVWQQGKLGDFIELKRGYDLAQAQRKAGSVPLVSSSGISDYVSSAMVKAPGVITGRYGTLGKVFSLSRTFGR